MFKVGDLVVYGNSGVCRVESIGPSALEGADKSKDYYFLTPYFSGSSRILIPCDNDKVVIRAIISREEATDLLNEISDIKELEITDEKNREQTYKDVMRRCDCKEIVSILKTIYFRKCARLAEGKKITASDEKYFLMAEEMLYGELSVALEVAKDKIKENVVSKIKAMA